VHELVIPNVIGFPNEPVVDRAGLTGDFRDNAGLLGNLPDRRLLGGLTGFDEAFG
jgi:hypothetical protein